MNIDIKDLMIYLSAALTLFTLYRGLVVNRQETQETNLKETDKAFAEFVKTYASQYSEIKTKVEYVERDITALYDLHEEVQKELIRVKSKLDMHTGQGGGE